ncbi:hypothetical protein D1614_22880 [Maribellus luteus]|uniref:Uncharacterized protein n=1 Tax=Maribellus luteus TaxID=2305463 RepID=A0A399STZ3_9BACT|nr:hypothetical protein D1614_22880 [Maribellus luteus]
MESLRSRRFAIGVQSKWIENNSISLWLRHGLKIRASEDLNKHALIECMLHREMHKRYGHNIEKALI